MQFIMIHYYQLKTLVQSGTIILTILSIITFFLFLIYNPSGASGQTLWEMCFKDVLLHESTEVFMSFNCLIGLANFQTSFVLIKT